MKSVMKMKPMHIFGILAIGLGLGVVGWVLLQPKEMEPIEIYKATAPKPRPAERMPEQERLPEQKDATAHKHDADYIQEMRDRTLSRLDEHPGSDAHKEAFKRAIESPAFAEYTRKSDAILPRTNLSHWWDFLESQGVGSGRLAQEENFREYFPTGEYADYEPMMRKRIAEIFLEMGPPDSTTEEDVVRHTLAGMYDFRKDDANRIWMRGQFNGYDGDLEWADEIRQNAASIVAEALPEQLAPEAVLTQPEPTEMLSSPTEPPPAPNTEEVTSFKDLETIPQTVEETQPIEEMNVPTDADFETALRQRFSPERFNTAMQTLNRYGPKEGLRRLKESDPEVAAQVERLIQRKQSRENRRQVK